MRPLDKLYQLKCDAERKRYALPGNAVAAARSTALEEAVKLVNEFLEQQATKEDA